MPMPFDDFERFVVVGFGMSGRAAVQALLDRELEVAVLDEDPKPGPQLVHFADQLSASGVQVRLGSADVSLLDWADIVVASPGVPPSNSFLQEALSRGVRIWSELELGWRMSKAPVIAITGTNGKTTTTRLVQHILEIAGISSVAAGNEVGVPYVEAVTHYAERRTIVCEVSSAQLFFIEQFRPHVAAVLNVADDHYDWHSGHEDYLAAKARITKNQISSDVLVVNALDDGCLRIAGSSKARICAFGRLELDDVRKRVMAQLSNRPESVFGIEEGTVVFNNPDGDNVEVMAVSDIRLQGAHNVENVLAAASVAIEYGVEPAALHGGIASFHGLPHRMTFVREVDGVRYIDDSKATNPHATLRALQDLENVILIAGGDAKGLDLAPLATARDRLNRLVVMGRAADELETLFRDLVPVERAADVEEAVAVARRNASPGDVVLLSPACASWDQYSGYAERGNRFQKAVLSL